MHHGSGGPEDESRPPPDTSRAGVADGPGEGCHTDDYQRGGGGLPWVLTDRVDEGRDGEDRPAAAERPQRHADQQPQGQRPSSEKVTGRENWRRRRAQAW